MRKHIKNGEGGIRSPIGGIAGKGLDIYTCHPPRLNKGFASFRLNQTIREDQH